MSETIFELAEPIEAHGEQVGTLTLRKPTPADARVIKSLPYMVNPEEAVVLLPAAAAQYIVRCAGIPPTSVDQIGISDFNKLCWVIAGFFLNSGSPKRTTSSEPPTT